MFAFNAFLTGTLFYAFKIRTMIRANAQNVRAENKNSFDSWPTIILLRNTELVQWHSTDELQAINPWNLSSDASLCFRSLSVGCTCNRKLVYWRRISKFSPWDTKTAFSDQRNKGEMCGNTNSLYIWQMREVRCTNKSWWIKGFQSTLRLSLKIISRYVYMKNNIRMKWS